MCELQSSSLFQDLLQAAVFIEGDDARSVEAPTIALSPNEDVRHAGTPGHLKTHMYIFQGSHNTSFPTADIPNDAMARDVH
jgi:hypothetical protein